jgi:hypothetical protein
VTADRFYLVLTWHDGTRAVRSSLKAKSSFLQREPHFGWDRLFWGMLAGRSGANERIARQDQAGIMEITNRLPLCLGNLAQTRDFRIPTSRLLLSAEDEEQRKRTRTTITLVGDRGF